jgi:hypothetical protein
MIATACCVLLLLASPQDRQQELGEPVVLAAGATQPFVAANAAGAFFAVFLHRGNVALSVSTDGGRTFTEPVVAIDAKGKARGGMQRGPRVALDAAGTIYVSAPLCFEEAELQKRYPTCELYLAASTDGGATFSPPLQVNDAIKQAPEALHWLAASPDGTVFVAWLDRRDRTGPGQDLAHARVTERGQKVGKNVVLPGPLCECCAPGLAVDGKGNPLLAWRTGGDKQNRPLLFAMSGDGGATFGAAKRLNKADSLVPG